MADAPDNAALRRLAEEFMRRRSTGASVSARSLLFDSPNAGSYDDLLALIRHDAGATPEDALPEIDGYEIIILVGQGGMGAVYEAFQQSTGRRVAVKVVRTIGRLAESTRRRFEREVDLAGRLDHPNIVRVIDSGACPAGPFLAMDFVDGRPLDQALVPGKEPPARVFALLAEIADAVEYAHQRGVLHRDLKPANILIDRGGRPRIVDFGLAKAIGPSEFRPLTSLSEPGQLVGTIAYMSPEQASADANALSVRTDVYALGAIGYELLTGRVPCDTTGALRDVLERIAAVDPPAPSLLRPDAQISRDADAVFLKALEKKPANRYPTAALFAADLRSLLAHRSVVARKVGPAGRAARWVRRNRAITAVATSAAIALLAVGAVSIQRVLAERDAARAEAQKAQQTLAFFYDMLRFAGPEYSEERDVTVRAVLDQTAANIDQEFANQPSIAAVLHAAAGRAYAAIGFPEQASRHLRSTIALGEPRADRWTELEIGCRIELASIHIQSGAFDEAQSLLDDVLRAPGLDRTLRFSARNMLAALRVAQHRLDDALAILDESAALNPRATRDENKAFLRDAVVRGRALALAERCAEAVSGLRAAFEFATTTPAVDPSLRYVVHRELILTTMQCASAGGPAAQRRPIEDARELVAAARQTFGDSSRHYANALAVLAEAQRFSSDHLDAEATIAEAMAIVGATPNPLNVASHIQHFHLQLENGDARGAADTLRPALAAAREHFGDRPNELGALLCSYALALCALAEPEDAQSALAEAELAFRRGPSGRHEPAFELTSVRAEIASLAADPAAERADFDAFLAAAFRDPARPHPELFPRFVLHLRIRGVRNDASGSERLARHFVARSRNVPGRELLLTGAVVALGQNLARQWRSREAELFLREAVELCRDTSIVPDWMGHLAQTELGIILAHQRRDHEAYALLATSLDSMHFRRNRWSIGSEMGFYDTLASVCERLDRPDEAARHRARAADLFADERARAPR